MLAHVAFIVGAGISFVRIRCKLCLNDYEKLFGSILAVHAVTAASQLISMDFGKTIISFLNPKAEAIASTIVRCYAPNATEKRVH